MLGLPLHLHARVLHASDMAGDRRSSCSAIIPHAVLHQRKKQPWRCDEGNMPVLARAQVEEMALQNITLRRSDGLRIFYPIVKLCTEPVFNVTRSNNRWEGFKARVLHRAL